MRLNVVAFSAKDWIQFSALLAAEIALAWLAVNVLFMPIDVTHQGMSALVVFVLLAGASVLPRLLHDYGAWGSSYKVVIAAGITGATLFAIKQTAYPDHPLLDRAWLLDSARSLAIRSNEANVPVWAIVLASAVAWWRGATREQPAIDAALVLLKSGVIVALVAVMAHAGMESGASDRDASAAVLAFVGAALTAIAMMRQDLMLHGSVSRWLETVFVPVLAITIPAAIIVGLLSRDLAGMIELFLDPLTWILSLFFRVLAFVIIVVAMIILVPLIWLVSLIPFSSSQRSEENPVDVSQNTLSNAAERAAEIPDVVRYLLVAAALILIYRGVTRFRLRVAANQDGQDGGLESSRVDASLLGDLLCWLRGALPGRSAPAPDPLAALRSDPRWRATIAVRERYADFLRWTRDHGVPRGPAMTPDELAGLWRLQDMAAAGDAVITITSIYDEVRYGGSPASEDDARRVTEAWAHLQRATQNHGTR